jgi:hypothetical protein
LTKVSGLPIGQEVLASLATDRLSETSAKISKISCITTQKSGELIYTAAEA